MGPGSLHDTLTHMVGAMWAWTDTMSGAEPRPRRLSSRRQAATRRRARPQPNDGRDFRVRPSRPLASWRPVVYGNHNI